MYMYMTSLVLDLLWVTIERFLGCAESAVLTLNNPMNSNYIVSSNLKYEYAGQLTIETGYSLFTFSGLAYSHFAHFQPFYVLF